MPPQLLSLLGCYWPGNEATGPNQSFRSLAMALRGETVFRVVGRSEHSQRIEDWRHDGAVERALLPTGRFGTQGLRGLIKETPFDILLLNGFFDREFTIPTLIMRRFGRIPRVPTILSPRGEFAGGALSLKSERKHAYLALVKQLGLSRDIWFHATESHEVEDIRQAGLSCRGILEAPNPRRWFERPAAARPANADQALRVAFLGRITPVKNVLFAIEAMALVEAPIHLDLYGPIADGAYWKRCEDAISRLPAQITVNHKGVLPNATVPETLASYDLFFLPTRGENFGHAINEALMSGLPALIANTTPWRGLEAARAGWDLPLGDPAKFAAVIDRFASTEAAAQRIYRDGARAFAEKRYRESDAIAAHRRMFDHVLEANVFG
ncbi:MAG: glycosyltransferase [Pseudomonadota bacterium]